MKANPISWLLLLPLVMGQNDKLDTNFTIAFFKDTQEQACQDTSISQALVLTTSNIPLSTTCINVTDIFSQSNDTGFTPSKQPIYGGSNFTSTQPQLNGINWSLQNRETFDPSANYSRVWFKQTALDGKFKENQDGRWRVQIYPFPDCVPNPGGMDIEVDDYPWYETSCFTESGGSCHALVQSIGSFSLSDEKAWEDESCDAWALFGDASSLLGRGVWGLAWMTSCLTTIFFLV